MTISPVALAVRAHLDGVAQECRIQGGSYLGAARTEGPNDPVDPSLLSLYSPTFSSQSWALRSRDVNWSRLFAGRHQLPPWCNAGPPGSRSGQTFVETGPSSSATSPAGNGSDEYILTDSGQAPGSAPDAGTTAILTSIHIVQEPALLVSPERHHSRTQFRASGRAGTLPLVFRKGRLSFDEQLPPMHKTPSVSMETEGRIGSVRSDSPLGIEEDASG